MLRLNDNTHLNSFLLWCLKKKTKYFIIFCLTITVGGYPSLDIVQILTSIFIKA